MPGPTPHALEALPVTPAQRPNPRHTFAAIDLGTNNCRLLVAVPTRTGFHVVDGFSRIVRLGEGLHDTGRLHPDAMDRAIEALHGCAACLAHHPVNALRAVATEACRRAVNGPAFLARARAETGITLMPITPREEAGLALESCAALLSGPHRRALLFDIGGGSTELAWARLATGAAPELVAYDSLPFGVVTLAERFGPAMFTDDGFAAMVEHARAGLIGFEHVHRIGQELRQGGVLALGTSGTATTLAGVALNLARYRRPLVDGITLPAADAERALHTLRALGPAGLAAHPCVGPDRAQYVLPGCAVFAAIQQIWALPEIMVADRGLREGILLRLIRAAQVQDRTPQRPPQRTQSPTPAA